MKDLETIEISLDDHIAQIKLNRPEKRNAMNLAMWEEIKSVFEWAENEPEVRVVVLSGAGKMFCSGIDLELFATIKNEKEKCPGRKREQLRLFIKKLQDCLTQIERCRKPVIAAVHGYAIGGALDLLACCDMRYCSEDAAFSIKEVDLGMTADVGSLQRLPHIISDGILRELAYTARNMPAEEALKIGLVNAVYQNKELLLAEVSKIAIHIAEKSPLAIRGTKEMIMYARDHTIEDSLNYVATWNAAMILNDDLDKIMQAAVDKTQPRFDN